MTLIEDEIEQMENDDAERRGWFITLDLMWLVRFFKKILGENSDDKEVDS